MTEHEEIISRKSREIGVDPDLVRSIMHIENVRGYYDVAYPEPDTLRPMNVHASLWKSLGYSRDDLENSKEKNIEAGIKIIKGISDRVPDKNIAKIATLYQKLGANSISQYGRRVKEFYDEKPWEKD